MGDIVAQLSSGPYVIVPVGSRRTCDPAPTDTDDDYLVLCQNKNETVRCLKDWGFEPPENIEEYIELHKCEFTSLRFGELNFIVTDNYKWFSKFLTASYFTKKYNVMDKKDRIEMFNAIMRRSDMSEEFAPSWQKIAIEKGLCREGSLLLASDEEMMTW